MNWIWACITVYSTVQDSQYQSHNGKSSLRRLSLIELFINTIRGPEGWLVDSHQPRLQLIIKWWHELCDHVTPQHIMDHSFICKIRCQVVTCLVSSVSSVSELEICSPTVAIRGHLLRKLCSPSSKFDLSKCWLIYRFLHQVNSHHQSRFVYTGLLVCINGRKEVRLVSSNEGGGHGLVPGRGRGRLWWRWPDCEW